MVTVVYALDGRYVGPAYQGRLRLFLQSCMLDLLFGSDVGVCLMTGIVSEPLVNEEPSL